MVRIAMIGAGSMVFSVRLISDILSFDTLTDTDFALMDIDAERLEMTAAAGRQLIQQENLDATIESTQDRQAALQGADYVLNLINVGGLEPFRNEIRIPEKYGVNQAIGDTLGPGGIFRGLRTIPTVLDIARDMETCCPDAPLLNYSNPMAMICWAVDQATSIQTIGLCHSVQHTVDDIAGYVDLPADELQHWFAGINHLAWCLECTHNGEDIYPQLREAMTNDEIYSRDPVRFEMLTHFGYFPTESSHHLSEYVPYFRTDEQQIERLTGEGNASRMPTGSYLEGWRERSETREKQTVDDLDLTVERSDEYAAQLIHSIETGTPRRMNLNVRNSNAEIENLPQEATIEIPCLVEGTGVHPCSIGRLPPQLAAITRSNIDVQEATVRASLNRDKDALYQALALDPLTSAVLNLNECRALADDLLAANAEYLPEFQ